MSQISFAEAEYQNQKRKTHREKFLKRMDQLIPWKGLEKKFAGYYPKSENGRRPYPLQVMLRIHCMQIFYNLSDPAMEDELYEIESVRRSTGLTLADSITDETIILNFRHFLEQHNLGKTMLKEMNKHFERQGPMLQEGSIVDGSIISARNSTKNSKGERDPEMHQTRKGSRFPRRESVFDFPQNGGNRTKYEQIDWGYIPEIGLYPDRNRESAFKPGYSQVP